MLLMAGLLGAQSASAALALDRTRVIFDAAAKSVSLDVRNDNKRLPYLAQSWIEDINGKRMNNGALTVLPPVQRIEAGQKSQVKIQGLPAAAGLPQDRESLFYFNLREIPPRSDKPNTLQIALQTRIKLFYRPAGIGYNEGNGHSNPAEQLTLTHVGAKYQVNNPTPYYITLLKASRTPSGPAVTGFEPLMVAPKSSATINVSSSELGDRPVLSYINDYGGRPKLQFTCSGNTCQAKPIK